MLVRSGLLYQTSIISDTVMDTTKMLIPDFINILSVFWFFRFTFLWCTISHERKWVWSFYIVSIVSPTELWQKITLSSIYQLIFFTFVFKVFSAIVINNNSFSMKVITELSAKIDENVTIYHYISIVMCRMFKPISEDMA